MQSLGSVHFISRYHDVFHRTGTNISNISMEPRRPTVIMRKNKGGGITLPNINPKYKVIVTKRARYLHKNCSILPRSMEQNNPEINSCLYNQYSTRK